ncbi:glycine zipper family protein [Coleofasciculus sp. G2-EDA-02]|uniref:glycine zipper family protein n=1 Tax=Coleofasciculus sp. G2-EDA-02 TaxID=3069529 RepID=UPI0032FD7D20
MSKDVGAGLGTIVGAGLGTIVGAGLGTKFRYSPITEQLAPALLTNNGTTCTRPPHQ